MKRVHAMAAAYDARISSGRYAAEERMRAVEWLIEELRRELPSP